MSTLYVFSFLVGSIVLLLVSWVFIAKTVRSQAQPAKLKKKQPQVLSRVSNRNLNRSTNTRTRTNSSGNIITNGSTTFKIEDNNSRTTEYQPVKTIKNELFQFGEDKKIPKTSSTLQLQRIAANTTEQQPNFIQNNNKNLPTISFNHFQQEKNHSKNQTVMQEEKKIGENKIKENQNIVNTKNPINISAIKRTNSALQTKFPAASATLPLPMNEEKKVNLKKRKISVMKM